MKKVRRIFKNAYKANRSNLNEMVARIDYNPRVANEIEDIMIPYLYCLKNAKVEEFDDDNQSRDVVFNSIFNSNIHSKLEDAFVDRVSMLFAMDKISCSEVKCMITELESKEIRAILKEMETMATNGVLTRNVIVSITNLVAKDHKGKYNFIPHIQMAMYDGHLHSPSGNILYLEKLIGKTRLVLIKKEAIDLKTYNYTHYELDNNSNILYIEKHENVKVKKNILKSISRKRLFTPEELHDKLIEWYKFKPREGAIQNGEKETTEIMGQELQ